MDFLRREASVLTVSAPQEKEYEEKMRRERESNARELFLQWKQEHIKLNVRGTYFHTTLSTLLRFPGNIFYDALRNNVRELQSEDDGSIFIDRSPELFRHILNYMQDPEGKPEFGGTSPAVQKEALFYKIAPMVEDLSESSSQEMTWDPDKSENT